MKHILFLSLLLLAACGKDTGLIQNGSGCDPLAIVDKSGGNQWLEIGNTDVAQLGEDPVDGNKYLWTGPDGLSDYHVAQPFFTATRAGDFVFTLKVTDKCGNSSLSDAIMHVLDEPKMSEGSLSIKIKDRFGRWNTFGTGYVPSRIPERKTYVHMPKAGYGAFAGQALPKEFNITPPNFLVHTQPNGSCWAEASSSAATANVWYFFKELWRVSTQRIIDCSGYGTASGGGQISTGDFLKPKGLVDEAVYQYNGYDHKCDLAKSIFRRQAIRHFEITNATGGAPSATDHKQAMVAFGAPEVCGAAGVMGDGSKWYANPGFGNTNHCYARFSYWLGELHGQTPGTYWGEQNSWGITRFGGAKDMPPGQAPYRVEDENGKAIKSSIETEHKYFELDNPCPPPIVDGGRDKTIRQVPGTPQFVRIGTPGLVGQTYLWDHVSDLKDPKSAIQAQVYASPGHTTKFTLTAKNSCAEAHTFVTVHVIEDIGGHLFEMTELGPKAIKSAAW